jgi:hypothetical protein
MVGVTRLRSLAGGWLRKPVQMPARPVHPPSAHHRCRLASCGWRPQRRLQIRIIRVSGQVRDRLRHVPRRADAEDALQDPAAEPHRRVRRLIVHPGQHAPAGVRVRGQLLATRRVYEEPRLPQTTYGLHCI